MQSNSSNQQSTFQILSLDGGGIKGLFSAALLAAIEEDLDTNIIDHFDLITGTSTGGIIALGLGLGFKPREIVDFYIEEGPKIFPHWYGWKWIQHWFHRKFSSKPLINALQKYFRDKRLGESQKRLVIPSYNLGEGDVYIFRTPHDQRLKRDYKVPAWKVALATSSAPTYFPCSREVNQARLIDGGVWANNPTMVGIIEAYGTLKVPLDVIRVFSIGTSDCMTYHKNRLNYGGKFSWALGNSAIDVIMRGQSIGINNQATFLLGKENILRLDPRVAPNEFSLDGVHKVDDLIGKAAHHSRIIMPNFEHTFMTHKAATYTPNYK